MIEKNFSFIYRQTQYAAATCAEKAGPSKSPNARFAWPFPVLQMQAVEGTGTRVVNSARTNVDGFVT